MRPRTELALTAGLLLLLGIVAVGLGTRSAKTIDRDPRRSTYLAGPSGARGFAEALEALGVRVDRFRRPTEAAEELRSPGERVVFAVVGPSIPLTGSEGRRLASMREDLLLAGQGAVSAMSCLGYRVRLVPREAAVRAPVGAEHRPMPAVHAGLVEHWERTVIDSSSAMDGRRVVCEVPPRVAADTLLQTMAGAPVAIRVAYPDQRTVTLVADDRLFRNRALRQTAAGPFVLGLVSPRYQRIVVDEYHHGYDAGGSLWGAALGWSLRSPWGWAVWQLAAVGVIALLTSGIRFGPVRSAIERRRRSPMEHIRALATALAAAKGHDVAMRLTIQGLRRRLSRSGRTSSADLDTWLRGLEPAVRTERGREALDSLAAMSQRPSAESVLVAANAVETLWEELRPS